MKMEVTGSDDEEGSEEEDEESEDGMLSCLQQTVFHISKLFL